MGGGEIRFEMVFKARSIYKKTAKDVTPVVEHWLEREIAQWVHHMKDRPDDPSHHERTLLPRRSKENCNSLRKQSYTWIIYIYYVYEYMNS